MSTLTSITVSELQTLLQSLNLPLDTKLSVTFEDEHASAALSKKQSALSAMKRLKGSGNGKLVSVLLEERRKDRLK